MKKLPWYETMQNIVFQSSSGPTPQWVAFAREVKSWLTKFCKENGYTDLKFNRGHFYFSGFFKVGNQWWYFMSSDVRTRSFDMLIREAQHDKDYSGGQNRMVKFDKNFDLTVKQYVEKIPFMVVR